MEKLQFTFEMKAASNEKSNQICLTYITTPEGQQFKIPIDYQPVNFHLELMETPSFAKIKGTLKKRHQSRKIWITLTDKLYNTYVDEDGNFHFDNYLLEEVSNKKESGKEKINTDETMLKILEKLLEEKQRDSEIQNLGKLAKDFMIEKFTGKNINAQQWIMDFEKECERFKIIDNNSKIEILQFFLEKTSKDWYSSMLLKFTVESEWETWKENFCQTFINKGWSPIRYALLFRYQSGSLLEYALKKEKLLLEVNKSIDKKTLIDLIATGLPNFICDKINRENITETEKLYNEIGNLEHHIYKNKEASIKIKKDSNIKEKIKKVPCKICKEKNKGERYHLESTCWFKEDKDEHDKIKHVNNTELEVELNYNNQKN